MMAAMVPGGPFAASVFALLGCSGITCGTLLRLGWHRRRPLPGRRSCGAPLPLSDLAEPRGRAALASGLVDVAAELRAALEQMAGVAAQELVRLEMAVPPDLTVRTDLPTLRWVLLVLVRHAIGQAPCGRVLLSAGRPGGRVQVVVMDDGAGRPASMQEAALRAVAEAVARQGGSLEIDAMPGEGTTITVRLPEPMEWSLPRAAVPAQKPVELAETASWEI